LHNTLGTAIVSLSLWIFMQMTKVHTLYVRLQRLSQHLNTPVALK